MGNKLYVSTKVTEIDNLLKLNENVSNFIEDNMIEKLEITDHQNLSIWQFSQDCQDLNISSKAIPLNRIKQDKFLFRSDDTYLILLIYKSKDSIINDNTFPKSLWSIIESSSNMTPRGLKYAFSDKSNCYTESLESFLLSQRDYEKSDLKTLMYIWNGKNALASLKSHTLVKAYDLDKLLSNENLVEALYNGYSFDNNLKPVAGSLLSFNKIINKEMELLNDSNSSTPTNEALINFQETVYLLRILYPIEQENTKIKTKSIFKLFNKMFLGNKTANSFHNNFLNIDSDENEFDDNLDLHSDKVYSIDSSKEDTSPLITTNRTENNNNVLNNLNFSFKNQPITIPKLILGVQTKQLNDGKFC